MIALLFFIFSQSHAQIERLNYRGYSARALGMGNAYTAVVDNHDALYYNPAALSQIQGMYLTIMDPYIGINDLTELQDTLEGASGSTGSSFVTLLNDLYGQNIWGAGGAKAGFSMKNFALMYYAQAELEGIMNNPSYPVFDVSYKNDIGIHLGFSLELTKNLYAGFGFRSIKRTGGEMEIGLDTLEDLNSTAIEDTLLREGTGVGADFGLLYQSDMGIKPSLAFSWFNMGDTSFTNDTALAPTSEKSYMAVGLGAHIEMPLLSIRPALDYKFLDREDIELGKKIDLGLEVEMPLLTARAGFHQGYYTLGTSVDLFFLRVDAATWAEELGAYPGQKEDRRYMIQILIELGVDADLNFFQLDAEARRQLKQRR